LHTFGHGSDDVLILSEGEKVIDILRVSEGHQAGRRKVIDDSVIFCNAGYEAGSMLQHLLASPQRKLPAHWDHLQDWEEVLASSDGPSLGRRDARQVGSDPREDEHFSKGFW